MTLAIGPSAGGMLFAAVILLLFVAALYWRVTLVLAALIAAGGTWYVHNRPPTVESPQAAIARETANLLERDRQRAIDDATCWQYAKAPYTYVIGAPFGSYDAKRLVACRKRLGIPGMFDDLR